MTIEEEKILLENLPEEEDEPEDEEAQEEEAENDDEEDDEDDDDEDDDDDEEEEEELVDPFETARDSCKNTHECTKLADILESCNDRVTGRSNTEESCVEEMMDMLHCVDHCATKALFQRLK